MIQNNEDDFPNMKSVIKFLTTVVVTAVITIVIVALLIIKAL